MTQYISLFNVLSDLKMTANNINENEKYIPDNTYYKQFIQDAIKLLKDYQAVICYYQNQVDVVLGICNRKGLKVTVKKYNDYYVVNKEII